MEELARQALTHEVTHAMTAEEATTWHKEQFASKQRSIRTKVFGRLAEAGHNPAMSELSADPTPADSDTQSDMTFLQRIASGSGFRCISPRNATRLR